jgi:hypothetical protein
MPVDGAKDYRLEEVMDELPVTRMWRSWIDEVHEEEAERSCALDAEICADCPRLKIMEGIRDRQGRNEVNAMLEKLVLSLEKNLRMRDQVLLRPCGQIDVVLENADEQCRKNVIQRLGTQVKKFWGPHFLDLSSAVKIREEKRVMACETVMRSGPGRMPVNIQESESMAAQRWERR